MSELTDELRNISQSMNSNELSVWFHDALPETVNREQRRLREIQNHREQLDSDARSLSVLLPSTI